jgi:hypothetical protein
MQRADAWTVSITEIELIPQMISMRYFTRPFLRRPRRLSLTMRQLCEAV